MRIVRVTTNQGIEDVTAGEIGRLLEADGIEADEICTRPWGLEGVVTARIRDESISAGELFECLRHARSVYHVVVHVGHVAWRGQSVENLAAELAALPLTLMEEARSFRASCSRVGEHPFHSPDVERALGSALQDRFGTPVDLENHDVNVRVDIVNDQCLCGYQLTGKKGMDRRYAWKYHPRVTLRTTVAYSMLVLAGYTKSPGDLLDPFCGSGTILLEAAAVSSPAPETGGVAIGAARGGVAGHLPRIMGSDIAERAVSGSRLNIGAAGYSERIEVNRADARELTAYHDAESVDYIVTNPPFGIRLGHSTDLSSLYRDFLVEARGILRPGGILALLVGKRRGRFNRILQATEGFGLDQVRIIEIGGVYPGLFVLRKDGGHIT